MDRLGTFLILCTLGCLTPGVFDESALAAQASLEEVPDGIACARCRIEHRTRVVLTSRTMEGEINELPYGVRVDPAGNFWVLAENSPPRSYNPNGTFNRTLGRTGQGPGELLAVHDMFWVPGDSVVTIDALNRRATVFGPDGRYVRDIRVPAPLFNTIVLRWPSQVLVSGHVAASAAGLPLHLASFADAEMKLVRSFGPDRGLLRPRYEGADWHLTARSRHGSIVTTKPDQFRLHIWDEEGSLRLGLVRRSAWFPDSGGGSHGTPSQPPTPAITAVDADRDGLIWVFVRVAAPTWRQAWARVPPGAREARLSDVDFQSLYRTRVEVIDPASRRVLATADMPGLTLAALGTGRVASYAADATGDPVVRIEEVRLIRPSRR